MSRITRRLAGVAVAGVCAAAALAAPTSALADPGKGQSKGQFPLTDLQILSFNDFHGNLEAPGGSGGRVLNPDGKTTTDAGGVEYLATHLAEARQGHPNTVTVAAGDLVGASPLLSALFHDEPTIRSMNALGLEASAVGNHEFDEGYVELQRLQNGGCLPDGAGANNQNSCPDDLPFEGAKFSYLAANVVVTATGKTVLPAYTIKTFPNGARVGFIGMTLKGTPNIVTASGVRGLEFRDEVETANALVPVLKKQGVKAIVVLVHEGGYPVTQTYNYTCDSSRSISGPIVQIAQHLDPEIDMIISGHTHMPYVCNIPDPDGNDRLVTSASSFGRLFTETDLRYNLRSNDIVRGSVKGSNIVVTRDVARDPVQTALINKYAAYAAPITSRIVGSITTDVTRSMNSAGESQLGDLIADAQRTDPSVVMAGRVPDIAFMNPGGIRADLTYNQQSSGEAPGQVTFGEAFTVQPFNNYLVSMDLTGAQVKTLLTEQWSGGNAASPRMLQVSNGFAYTYSRTSTGRTLGAVTLNGAPLVDSQVYRVVANSFLSDGGDGFATFKSATAKYFGGMDIDAFANYLGAHSPYTPGALSRITQN